MKVDYNPYEGRQVTGATDTVLSRGRLVIEDGKFVGRPGAGSVSETGEPVKLSTTEDAEDTEVEDLQV